MRRLDRRHGARWTSALLAAGIGMAGCGREPMGETDPYRVHPSAEPAAPPAASPSVPPTLPKLPPPETGTPAPYPYPTPELPLPEPFEVVGQILLRGAPAAGIPVSVIHDRTYRQVRVTTDAAGIYRAPGLAEGGYFVHYYNDRDNFKVGYWKTRTRIVNAEHGARHPAFDLYLVGMQNDPGMGAAVSLPARFAWEPYPLALRYRFRVHNRGGPSGKPYYVSPWLDAAVDAQVYDGRINQKDMGEGKLGPGRYLWGVYWDAGLAGEGGNLYQDFLVRRETLPSENPAEPPPEDPPEDDDALERQP